MGCGSTNIPNELKESPHYFRQEELSYINEQKEKELKKEKIIYILYIAKLT